MTLWWVTTNVSWWLATLEVLARQRCYHTLEYCQLCQRRANAGSVLLALDWHWHSGGHTVTALSTLAVSAASARRRPTSMLCNIQHIHDGWPREGGIMGGEGVVTPILCVHFCVHWHRQYIRAHQSYTDTLIAKPTQYDTATRILDNLPDG